MSWEPWSRVDARGLARYVSPAAGHWLALDVNRFDLKGSADEHRLVAQAIYDALLNQKIRYAHEEYHPSAAVQRIRTPAELLTAPRHGTCLDLAALFCGLCLQYELLPLLIVTEDHAFAAVSTKHGLRDWDSYRPERDLFEQGPITDAATLRDLLETAYLPIECTGFSHSAQLEAAADARHPETVGRRGGVMTFERAVAAGRERLALADFSLAFALDVAVAHYGWRMEPFAMPVAGAATLPNVFELYAQSPTLADQIRIADFKALVADRTRRFVGRGFIFDGIDAAIADPGFPSGYIVIRGEPGIGKTSVVAELVRTRGYVHHFNIAPQNIRSSREFLTNVCAQLVLRYELGYKKLPPEATANSLFLTTLLSQAVARSGGHPIVVLVDALDEAEDFGLPADANRLFLPATLPDDVFFVVTTREEHDSRLAVDRRRDLYIRDNDPRNVNDVEQYIRAFLAEHAEAMAGRITAWRVDEPQFVDILRSKSDGNFMYIVHVLRDIRDGTLTAETVDDVRKLPTGLRSYYQRHWRAMREKDPARFELLYEPVVCTLAVAQRPVTIPEIGVWASRLTGATLSPLRIREVIRDWRQFLEEQPGDGDTAYRIYHASFQDFLREEVGLTRYNDNIAQTALDKIPGWQAKQ